MKRSPFFFHVQSTVKHIVCLYTGVALNGARFRLEGLDQFGVHSTWYATSENGVARFDEPFISGETYIVTEIQALAGYVLMAGPRHHFMSVTTQDYSQATR